MSRKFLLCSIVIFLLPITSYAFPIIDFDGSQIRSRTLNKYYDATTDTFTASLNSNSFFNTLLLGGQPNASITDYNASLTAIIDEFGTLNGGTFNITGGIADLGISSGTTLLAGSVSGIQVRASGTTNPTDPTGMFSLLLLLDISSNIGGIGFDSGQALWDLGFSPLLGAPDTLDTLFTSDWGPQGAALADILSEAAVPVSEPTSLFLFGLGLIGLGFVQRKQRH